jgi:4,5-DOPA dioxygenase extradiol
MPVVFVGHGSPMNAIELNGFTRQWAEVGHNLPKAQAIVVISAHWQTYGTHITDAPKQPLIYDMYGFPDQLYRFQYDANGDPALAIDLQKLLIACEAQLDSNWGLDHGTWSVLAHLAPTPKVPVLQISLDMKLSLQEQYELFATLAPLRQKGVLFIGSGNIVHNLGRANFSMPTSGYDWGLEFDEFAKNSLENREIDKLITPDKFTDSFIMAAPTDEHYRPLLATMALAGNSGDMSFFAEGMAFGSISMRSVLIK